MDVLDVARWQFGITTVYHFLFVPMTIGLGGLVAGLQTAWVRTEDERYLKLTKYFGKLFLINFAMGVVTGIVQEFQFGMNWSAYSRFVGDIFGAPLAVEALLAFFLESTFLGLWIFGWDKLSKKVHLAMIWLASIGTILSAYFILAANSFMQHPVGYKYNAVRGRAEMTSFWKVLTNKVVLVTFPHTIFAAFMVGGAFILAVALWNLYRRPEHDGAAFRTATKFGSWTLIVSGAATAITGDLQGKVMTDVQPMKMAAAEALYNSKSSAPFSLFTIGSLNGSKEIFSIKVPDLLSFLATGSFSGNVKGINQLQAEYAAKYGATSYKPVIPVTYWSFRLMIGLGALAVLIAIWVLWSMRKGRTPNSKWMIYCAASVTFLPLIANSFGWIFTEMGRQPWLVFGLLPTGAGVSPGTTTGEVLTSLIGFTLLYGVLAVIEGKLILRYIQAGLPEVGQAASGDSDAEGADAPLAFAY